MPRLPRYLTLLALLMGLATLAASPGLPGNVTENLRQLQAMPRERRIALSENLERFDKLNSTEQAAIRKLDAEIARKDPVEQARYRSLLRRYHLWVNGLTDEEKAQLTAADSPSARFNLASKFRVKELEGGAPGPRVFGIRTGNYGLIGPYEAANLLRIWKPLTQAKKFDIEKLRDRNAQFKEIRAMHKTVGVPLQHFAPSEEKHYDALLDSDKNFKNQVGQFAKRVMTKNETPQQRFELRFTEFLYFEDHKPKKVSQVNLERFSASCPNWLHEMLDPLSPDDARAYLTILYRLLYPEPGEMPVEPKAVKSTPTPNPSTTKKSAQNGPL